jgi:superfamily II DNA or RNA helicase
VLADAVGLGKTWQALAVMKFFEIKGYEVIVICPKKLENNWTKYLMRKNSKFENDRFNYVVRFHTDLQEDRLEKDGIKIRDYFQSDKPKLFVIDESHHLRNDKSARYQFFVEELLRANKDVKVLLLSATPINTKLLDVRNQFKLLVKGNDDGFKETLNINNLTWLFANAQKQLEKWQSVENHNKKISDFITKLPEDFFRLTDSLLVARTRALIKDQHENLFFPEKEPPENIFISPENIGNLKKFDDIFRTMKINLTAYRPYEYTQVKEVTSILEDEKQREKFLVKMMYILLVKRLESSWFSFKNTVETILTHHENALQKVKLFIEKKKEEELALDLGNLEEDFEGNLEDIELDEITLGKKSPIRLLDITDIRKFKAHIEKDIQKLKNLYENLEILAKQISHEKSVNSVDRKLEKLIQIISEKQKKKNKKIVVFSVFKDTIDYLYAELRKRGFKNIAMVSGQESKTDDGYSSKNFEPILERFAPYTKLYNEKEWDWFYSDHEIKDKPDFKTWCRLIRNFEPKTAYCLDNPIEILLATDCLSEGQNLQDCDCVVNYDIHWNPVRIIQRMGRIDRLASPNAKIKGFNFWPAKNYEDFLRLKSRVEIRMALLPLVGAEYEETLTEELQQIVKDNPLISKQTQKMLDQLQTTWDEIDKDDETLGMDDLSLETFRQELLEDFRKHEEKYKNMPNGIYSGFKGKPDIFQMVIPKGLIAMIASPVKPNGVIEHDYTYKHLLYTTPSGNSKYINPKDILSVLRKHKTENRFVPDGIDTGDKAVIETYIKMLKDWLVFMGGSEKGEAGEAAKSAIKGIMQGQPIKTDKIPDRKLSEDYFRPDKFDLICWLAIS